jgi:NDP-sugar pyrophosphorylase family protein
MGSLTESTPKPLIPVAGKPLLEHVLAHLSSHGVEEVALATNYRAEQIEAFAGDGSRFGVKIRTIREPQRMGTAGALSLLDPIPKAPFYVVNGDVLTKLHLGALSRHRHRTGAAIAMAVAAHVVESPFGVVRLAGTRVVDLTEKPRLHQWVNAGLYVLEPRVAASVPRSTYVDMTTMIDKWIQRGEPVEAFPIREYWRDAGTPEDLARADKELR